jgi:hypothetical protein
VRGQKKRQEAGQHKASIISSEISEAVMAGDYDSGYFAEGAFYPFDNDPKPSLTVMSAYSSPDSISAQNSGSNLDPKLDLAWAIRH